MQDIFDGIDVTKPKLSTEKPNTLFQSEALLCVIVKSKRYHRKITTWTECFAKVVAIIKDNVDTVDSLQSVTTNCLEKDLRTEKTDFSIQNMIPEKLNVDRVAIYILKLPTEDAFTSNFV
jgi:hypothetical protein